MFIVYYQSGVTKFMLSSSIQDKKKKKLYVGWITLYYIIYFKTIKFKFKYDYIELDIIFNINHVL